MSQILALQGLENEAETAYNTVFITSHMSSAAHLRAEQPVSDEAVR